MTYLVCVIAYLVLFWSMQHHLAALAELDVVLPAITVSVSLLIGVSLVTRSDILPENNVHQLIEGNTE